MESYTGRDRHRPRKTLERHRSSRADGIAQGGSRDPRTIRDRWPAGQAHVTAGALIRRRDARLGNARKPGRGPESPRQHGPRPDTSARHGWLAGKPRSRAALRHVRPHNRFEQAADPSDRNRSGRRNEANDMWVESDDYPSTRPCRSKAAKDPRIPRASPGPAKAKGARPEPARSCESRKTSPEHRATTMARRDE